MPVHFEITITGHVQGVGFRWHARKMAEKLGVKGFVKNGVDGSVYIEAEGSDIQLQQFITWCKSGPDHARVEHVQIETSKPYGYTAFIIKRSF